ncbi:hypothetical protein BS78_02G170400 [Paspalum vaginatum]|nr:hypothetical protein BS78_02G170400 [Paspalum vaginatum]
MAAAPPGSAASPHRATAGQIRPRRRRRRASGLLWTRARAASGLRRRVPGRPQTRCAQIRACCWFLGPRCFPLQPVVVGAPEARPSLRCAGCRRRVWCAARLSGGLHRRPASPSWDGMVGQAVAVQGTVDACGVALGRLGRLRSRHRRLPRPGRIRGLEPPASFHLPCWFPIFALSAGASSIQELALADAGMIYILRSLDAAAVCLVEMHDISEHMSS